MLVFLFAELAVFDRRQKREIRHLENEITKWQYLVDSVTGRLCLLCCGRDVICTHFCAVCHFTLPWWKTIMLADFEKIFSNFVFKKVFSNFVINIKWKWFFDNFCPVTRGPLWRLWHCMPIKVCKISKFHCVAILWLVCANGI